MCNYIAKKSEPETWNGDEDDRFFLDWSRDRGGLEIDEWHCPHPSLDGEERCIFHTDLDDLPENVNESEAIREALRHAGEKPDGERPEHRGQFVGATFGAVNLSDATIAATDEHDVRFDHAEFCGEGETINFEGATFVTEGTQSISCYQTTFRTDSDGDVSFNDTTFRTNGGGDVYFNAATFKTGDGDVEFTDATFRTGAGDVKFIEATFRSDGDGDLIFSQATFRTGGKGDVEFYRATFSSNGDGSVVFRGATFKTADNGHVQFTDVMFRTDGDGSVVFINTKFKTGGNGSVTFTNAVFKTDCDGGVSFVDATFKTTGNGDVRFGWATFKATGDGDVRFEDTTYRTGSDGDVWFGGATFSTIGDGVVWFKGSTFSTVSGGRTVFEKATFRTEGDGNIGFIDTTFKTSSDGDIWFKNATFKTGGNGDVEFRDATFKTVGDGDIEFRGTTFRSEKNILFKCDIGFDRDDNNSPTRGTDTVKGKLEATSTTGNKEKIRFDGTTFAAGEYINFKAASIAHDCSFRNVDFEDPTLFINILIEQTATLSFSGSEFYDECVFGESDGGSRIEGKLEFSDVTFHAPPDFRGGQTVIDEDERLDPPYQKGDHSYFPADHEGFEVVFADGVTFENAMLPEGTDLSHTWFPSEHESGNATFDRATLSQVNFVGADLAGVSFERAQLNRAELLNTNLVGAKLYGALLGDARINRRTNFWPSKAGLNTSVVSRAKAIPMIFGRGKPPVSGCFRRFKTLWRGGTLPYCSYDPRYNLINDRIAIGADTANDDLEKAAEVYGSLETLAHANSLPGLASECFVGRKDVHLRQYWGNDERRGRQWLMTARSLVPTAVARYGESPWRVLGTGGAIVLVWGVIYWLFDLIERAGESSGDVTLLESIYFSSLTFTTLGYGDFRPTNTVGQFFAVLETSLGVILLAILVFVFGRRATR